MKLFSAVFASTLALGSASAFAQSVEPNPSAAAATPAVPATPATPATPADPATGTAAVPATPATPAEPAVPAVKADDPLAPDTTAVIQSEKAATAKGKTKSTKKPR